MYTIDDLKTNRDAQITVASITFFLLAFPLYFGFAAGNADGSLGGGVALPAPPGPRSRSGQACGAEEGGAPAQAALGVERVPGLGRVLGEQGVFGQTSGHGVGLGVRCRPAGGAGRRGRRVQSGRGRRA